MNYDEVEVPYTMIAQTKEKPDDKCEEKGNLIIKAFYYQIEKETSSNYDFFKISTYNDTTRNAAVWLH